MLLQPPKFLFSTLLNIVFASFPFILFYENTRATLVVQKWVYRMVQSMQYTKIKVWLFIRSFDTNLVLMPTIHNKKPLLKQTQWI